jgi:polar amino acid transport system substrate-binding protein
MPRNWRALQQLVGRRVGTVLGYTYPKPHQVLGDQPDRREDAVPIWRAILRKLMVGRIEFALTEQLAFSAFMKGHPDAALRIELVLEPFTAPLRAVAAQPAFLWAELNRVLRQLQQEGAIDADACTLPLRAVEPPVGQPGP